LLIINTNEIPLFISTGFHQRRSGRHRTGSQYQQQAEAGDRRAQYYLADTWVSSGDYQKAEYWAQKAAAQGDGDALALLAQLKIRNPSRRTIRRPASWRKKPSRSAVNPGRSSWRGCW
jgi:TPR repeat protein